MEAHEVEGVSAGEEEERAEADAEDSAPGKGDAFAGVTMGMLQSLLLW
jgi:hypothetical protein